MQSKILKKFLNISWKINYNLKVFKLIVLSTFKKNLEKRIKLFMKLFKKSLGILNH